MKAMWNINVLRGGVIAVAFACLLPAADTANQEAWQIGAVDATAAGRFSSLKLDAYGNAHVAYIADDGQNTLKYAFWDHVPKRWFTTSVRKGADFCSLALDSKQRPHISFVDAGSGKGSHLRYVYWDGSAWSSRPIELSSDVIAFYTSITLDANDQPTLSYYEYEGPGGIGFVLGLRTVSWDGKYWEGRTVDATPGSGKFNFLIGGSGSRLQVAYANVKDENASLRYAYFDGKSWVTEVLEGRNASFYANSVGAAVDSAGTPHIVYTDVVNRRIKYATLRGGKWEIEVVDSIAKEAYPDRNGIALDAEGTPYVSYFDAASGRLKLAYRKGSSWQTETVDQNGAGFCSSLQIHDNTLWVTYADEVGGALKVARRILPHVGIPAQQGVGQLSGERH